MSLNLLDFYRGKVHGDVLRLQVHRDIRRHQSQRRRAAGRPAHANTSEAREPREDPGDVSEKVAEESQQVPAGLVLGEQLA